MLEEFKPDPQAEALFDEGMGGISHHLQDDSRIFLNYSHSNATFVAFRRL